jgi:hypothetical protein
VNTIKTNLPEKAKPLIHVVRIATLVAISLRLSGLAVSLLFNGFYHQFAVSLSCRSLLGALV